MIITNPVNDYMLQCGYSGNEFVMVTPEIIHNTFPYSDPLDTNPYRYLGKVLSEMSLLERRQYLHRMNHIHTLNTKSPTARMTHPIRPECSIRTNEFSYDEIKNAIPTFTSIDDVYIEDELDGMRIARLNPEMFPIPYQDGFDISKYSKSMVEKYFTSGTFMLFDDIIFRPSNNNSCECCRYADMLIDYTSNKLSNGGFIWNAISIRTQFDELAKLGEYTDMYMAGVFSESDDTIKERVDGIRELSPRIKDVCCVKPGKYIDWVVGVKLDISVVMSIRDTETSAMLATEFYNRNNGLTKAISKMEYSPTIVIFGEYRNGHKEIFSIIKGSNVVFYVNPIVALFGSDSDNRYVSCGRSCADVVTSFVLMDIVTKVTHDIYTHLGMGTKQPIGHVEHRPNNAAFDISVDELFNHMSGGQQNA